MSVLENRSSVLFQILKRLVIHLSLISKYEHLNKHSLLYLINLFESLIPDGKSLALNSYFKNLHANFDLSENFFQNQYKIIDKLLTMKTTSSLSLLKNRFNFRNYLIRVYYLNDAHSSPFFQVSIDSSVKVADLLARAKEEFKIDDEYCLFEVIDRQKCTGDTDTLLERLLPVNSLVLDTLANWNAFYYAVKKNYIQSDEELTTNSFFDTCYVFVGRKWQSSYISVQNANIRLFSKLKHKHDFEEFNLQNSRLMFEVNMKNCLVYYGMLFEPMGKQHGGKFIESVCVENFKPPIRPRL